MRSLPTVKVLLCFQSSPHQYLDVASALVIQPDAVRDALLDAIRHTEPSSTDISLLHIEKEFRSALALRWREPTNLRLVLESCHQLKIENRTERLFFEHGGDWGIVLLGLGTKKNRHSLFREIDSLPDDALIKLVKNVTSLPKTLSANEFLEEFAKSPQSMVFLCQSVIFC